VDEDRKKKKKNVRNCTNITGRNSKKLRKRKSNGPQNRGAGETGLAAGPVKRKGTALALEKKKRKTEGGLFSMQRRSTL